MSCRDTMRCACSAEQGRELGEELCRRLKLERCASLEERLEVLRRRAGEYAAFTWERAEGGVRLTLHGGMFFHAIKHTDIGKLRRALCGSLRSFLSACTSCEVRCVRCGERCEMLIQG